MCGRYVLKQKDLEALLHDFGLRTREAFASRHNIAPTSTVPALRRPPSGAMELAPLRWGLIPNWSDGRSAPRPLVNVRLETLRTRRAGLAASRRCVMPASGFYEWEAIGNRSRPWYFRRQDEQPFGLAAVWETWRAPDGEALETCAVITTAPNPTVARVHHRMPLLLPRARLAAWLSDAAEPPLDLLEEPADATLIATRVGPAVSNVRNDGPECLLPASDPAGGDDASPQLSLGL